MQPYAGVADLYAWGALFLLGCYHGINPGMGWLFAVALGLQEKSSAAVFRAVIPIALGHVVSVALVVALAVFAAEIFPHAIVHRVAAGVLLAFGAYRLVRSRHPRWVGMRVGFWGLALWGFLMSSAHGAGLMLLPFVTAVHAADSMNMAMPSPPQAAIMGWAMIAVHTVGYCSTMALVAWIVYEKVGVRFLRQAWVNLDLVWAAALLVAGIVSLMT